jgi:predicted PurR-regulated permease PerM
MTSSSNGFGTKFLLASASIIIILAGLKASQTLIAPFLLAVFFALVLMPPLRFLKQKGLSDIVALIALSVIVFLFGLGVVLIFSSSLTNFADRLPTYREKTTAGITILDDWINVTIDRFEQVNDSFPKIQYEIETEIKPEIDTELKTESKTENVNPVTPEVLPEVPPEVQPESPRERFSLLNIIQLDTLVAYVHLGVKELLNVATVSSLIAIMVIFMLIEASRMPEKVREAFGGRDLSNEYFNKIAADTWNYMKIKTIVSLLTGLATATGLWFLGVEYALLWGILMFFLNYIPNIGSIIAAVPPILLALIDQGLTMGIIVTIYLIVVNMGFGYGVEPRFLGEGLGISSLIVLLSLIFWGWLLGPIGMFLSAPLTMVLKIVLQNDPKTRWVAVLLSNRA